MTTVTVQLSEDVARRAQQEGLLAPDTLNNLLREEMRRRAARKLLGMTKTIVDSTPPLGDEEVRCCVQEVIAACRGPR